MAITINHQTNDISATSGSMTIDGASAGGGTASFVASGAIANGDTVILNSNGTVSVAGNYGDPAIDTTEAFESGNVNYVTGIYDANSGKVVVYYQDAGNSSYGTAAVGTISGTSLSFGTPVVFNSATTQRPRSVYDSNANKSAVIYEDFGDSSIDAKVGTVSGTSISFGSKADVHNGVNSDYGDATFDSSNNKVIFAWKNSNNSNRGSVKVGTISGTSISFGGYNDFPTTGAATLISCCFDSSNNKVVISYRDAGNSNYGTALVGTVSGTSMSYGTAAVFNSSTISGIRDMGGCATFDSNANKVVLVYGNFGNSGRGTAIVGTVSGTSISFGTANTFINISYVSDLGVAYDAATQKVVATYRDSNDGNKGKAITGTVSGTSISFNSSNILQLHSGYTHWIWRIPTTGGKVVIPFSINASPATAVLLEMAGSNITATNFLGLAAGAISDTATGAITITGGTNTAQSGLTVGEDYFVADDGTLTTTNNSRKVGRATATTKILVNPALLNDEVKSGSISFTASGEISAGNTVVVSGNNTVSQVAQSGDPVIGAVNQFNGTDNAEYISLTYDTNNDKVVLSWQDEGDSSKGKTLVGTVAGNTVSFGTAVEFESGNTDYIASCFDSSNNKIVIAYRDTNDTNQGKAIIGTVSGNSISFGTPVIFETGNTQAISCCFDSTNEKVVIMYVDAGNNGYVTGIVGTVSGTSISFGTPTVAVSSYGNETSCVFGAFDGANSKVAVQYVISTSNYAIVGTVSGTSISFGTSGGYIDVGGNKISTAFDSDTGKVIFGYKYSNRPTMKLGTVSGTSITYGSRAYASSQTATHFSTGCAYDPNTQKIAFFYRADSGGSYGTWMNLGTVSGAAVTFGTEQQVADGTPNFFSTVYDPDNLRILLAYEENEGVIQTIATTGTNASKFVGLAQENIANGATGKINIVGGVNTSLTGLTAGDTYYVKDNGALGTANTGVTAGIALSATDLLVKG